MAFKMRGPFFFKNSKHKNKSDHDFVHGGNYKIVREKLEEGVLGEAENGNVIKVDISVEPGSIKEKEVVAHEGKHQDEMNIEDENGNPLLSYTDDAVIDNIAKKTYKRKDGYLIDESSGKKHEEGDPLLAHEVRAWSAGEKAKTAFTKKTKK